MKKGLIVVLGMHRSGTSAITRGLQVLGVDLGQSFIPNYDDNVKGFWEDKDFQALNVAMLKELGAEWHSLGLVSDESLPERLSDFRFSALNLLRQKVAAGRVFGVKDPRFCRLMPFWQKLFVSENIEVSYIIPLRNPISVALSLQKRNNLDFEKSIYLWYQHMLLSVLMSDPKRSIVVDFDKILSEPGSQLKRISRSLNLSEPAEHLLQDYDNDYLDLALCHNNYTISDLENESGLPACVIDTFIVFYQLATDSKELCDNEVRDFFVQQWECLSKSRQLFSLFDHQDRQIRTGVQREDALNQKISRHVQDISQQTNALQQLRETLERQKKYLHEQSEQFLLNVESHKHELNEQNEHHKRDLEHQNKRHKHELDEQSQNHKNELSDQNEKHKHELDEQCEKSLLNVEGYKYALIEQKKHHKHELAEQNERYIQVVCEKEAAWSQQQLDYIEQESQKDQEINELNALIVSRRNEIDRLRQDLGRNTSILKQKETELRLLAQESNEVSKKLNRLESNYNGLKADAGMGSLKFRVVPKLILQGVSHFRSLLNVKNRKKNNAKLDTAYNIIMGSGLFDEQWYLKGFSGNRQPREPLQHYIDTGWREKRSPSILFDGNWYLECYPDVKAGDVCPLFHYLKFGWQENRQPHPDFDGVWYLQFYGDVRMAKLPPLQHYKLYGAAEGRGPSRLFDVEWYSERYGAFESPLTNALEHYLLASKNKSVSDVQQYHPLFSADDYAAGNPDFDNSLVSASGHCLSRLPAYLQEITQRSCIDEGITKAFDIKVANEFCQRLQRNDLLSFDGLAQPLVSIVMPTHNRRNKIFNAIDSVLNQSYANWELLIVDDGSEDGTYNVVRDEYTDDRINIVRTAGYGVCHARNTALAAAKGDLIAYLDSDNTWVVNFLELMVINLEHHNADFSYSAIRLENEQGTNYRYRDFVYKDLLIKNYIDLNAILHKRHLYERIGGFDEKLSRMVDWDLIIRYTHNSNVASAPFIGVYYDNHKQADRITVKEPKSWRYVIMNKHLIDWAGLGNGFRLRDKNLVSIVIPIYGQLALTRKCVLSLLTVPAGCAFEIILVDNGSNHDVLEELFFWSEGNVEIRLVSNAENLNFALGCNLGFAAAKGDRVVFLNNDTEVTSGWLHALVKPLADQDVIGAVQPKLLYPDGRIQCAGIVFEEGSPIGLPIYADYPSYLPHLQKSRSYQAVTAACMAVKSTDFLRLRGFDPLYVNGQEDVDFCMRLAEMGKNCWYAADSVVLHYESRTPGRGQFINQNRELFAQRWAGKIKSDAESYFHKDGFRVKGWRSDQQQIAARRPLLSFNKKQQLSLSKRLTFAIKIPCPHEGIKEEWGDYHFACSLGAALRRAGHTCRIDFLQQWNLGEDNPNEVNLVLRGLSVFEPRPNQINLMWMISHPDKVDMLELEQYDHIFVASEFYADFLQHQFGDRVSCLLQCTDPVLFHPEEKQQDLVTDVLFVGNSRNQYREIVKAAVNQEVSLSVYGTRWEQFLPDRYIKGQNIPNQRLAAHYRNAKVVLNDHWPDMRLKGFVSNRIFDVLACGVPVVSDNVSGGFPDDLEGAVIRYDEVDELARCILSARHEDINQKQKRFEVALNVHEFHSFDARVEKMLAVILGQGVISKMPECA